MTQAHLAEDMPVGGRYAETICCIAWLTSEDALSRSGHAAAPSSGALLRSQGTVAGHCCGALPPIRLT